MATNVHTTTPVPHENDPPRDPSVGYSAHEDAAQLRRERTRSERGSRLLLQRLVDTHGQ